MGKIVKEFEFRGDKGKAKVKALMDTGASVSLIRKDIAEKIASHFLRFSGITLSKVDGKRWKRVREAVHVVVVMKGKELDFRFYVIDDMPREAIIGVDFLQTWEIKLFPKKHDFSIGIDPNSVEIA